MSRISIRLFFGLMLMVSFLGWSRSIKADTNIINTEGAVATQTQEQQTTSPNNGVVIPMTWLIAPEPPEKGFRFLINNGADYTNTPIVSLNLIGTSEIKRMAISNFSDFRDASQEPYKKKIKWDLCREKTYCAEGRHIVYVKFYTLFGVPSKAVSNSIIYRKTTSGLVLKKIQAKIEEISNQIIALGEKITHLFSKDVSVKKLSKPFFENDTIKKKNLSGQDNVPFQEENVPQPRKAVSSKQKAGVFDIFKQDSRRFWQNIVIFWQIINNFLFKI